MKTSGETIRMDDTPSIDNISDQLKRDVERAERVQKQMRKNAPKNITVSAVYVDPRETMVRRLVPDAFWQGSPTSDKGQGRKGSIPPKVTTFFDRPSRHKDNIAKGYVPVIEDGEHAQQSGDLLYMRPVEFSEMAKREASLRSQKRLTSMDEQAKKDGLLERETETISKIADGSDIVDDNK